MGGDSLSRPESQQQPCVFLNVCCGRMYLELDGPWQPDEAARMHSSFTCVSSPSRSHELQSPEANGTRPPRSVNRRHDPCPDQRTGGEAASVKGVAVWRKTRQRSRSDLTETKGRGIRGGDGEQAKGRRSDGASSEGCWSLLKRTRVLLNPSKLQRLFIKALPRAPPHPTSPHPPSHPPLLRCLPHSLSPSPLPPLSH